MRWTAALVVVAAVAPAAQQRPTFHATANTVVVQATVLERYGRLIPDLTRDDFEVWEDGKRRPITAFAREQVAVSVAILLDLSGSVRRPASGTAKADELVRRMRAATESLVIQRSPEDRASVGIFGDRIGQSGILGGDKRPLPAALDKHAHKLEPGRRIVLVFTDGAQGGPPIARFERSAQPGTTARDLIARAVHSEFMAYRGHENGPESGPARRGPAVHRLPPCGRTEVSVTSSASSRGARSRGARLTFEQCVAIRAYSPDGQ